MTTWDMGAYPTTQQGLGALFQTPEEAANEKYKGPYMVGEYEELRDPWNRPFGYRCPGVHNKDSYDRWSYGPDGKDDGGKNGSDDVTNWSE